MALSPMMQHYKEVKAQHEDCVLFYRLGDFYEMFFEDAQMVSKELELTLTGRDCGLEERAPMCGVPYHAAQTYIDRLIKKGYKVAICDQLEDPKSTKGMVKRGVTKIVTPGTNMDGSTLEETRNNYLMSIVDAKDHFGICTADVSTGDCFVTEVEKSSALEDEIQKYSPTEIICSRKVLLCGVDFAEVSRKTGSCVNALDDGYFDNWKKSLINHFGRTLLASFGLSDFPDGMRACGVLFSYLFETQKNELRHMNSVSKYVCDRFMLIDSSSRRNLEITETLRDKQKKGSLIGVLDNTCTAMGARMLRSFLEQPLISVEKINARLDAVEDLTKSEITREEIRNYLSDIYDLERLVGRICARSASPRDLIAFKNSVLLLPYIKQQLEGFSSKLLVDTNASIDTLEGICDLIDRAISDDAPFSSTEGGVIKEGYDDEVDSCRKAKFEGKTWISELESKEKAATGIKNLKIKYNKVFGYYIEVTNSYKSMVPEHYVRKQTLTNAERYITPRLKELEDMILGAEDKLYALEYRLFCEVRGVVAEEAKRIQTTAKAIALIDTLVSFATVAVQNGYTRPVLCDDGVIDIKGGRHPVVEHMLSGEPFVENDTYLDNDDNRVSVITGPNMAGKSTYMRQNALIVIMAQTGCFVPAQSAKISVVDRIFTRVGASDDLTGGKSTFMVEMSEMANILKNATSRSLLILDEIGRGTSTFDGLSIAWAVIEYIANKEKLGAKTLFATHYHELTELEGKLEGVKNYCILVKERGEDIVFLRKIERGGADKSYGIQVARLAGVPSEVTNRASELLGQLSKADITSSVDYIISGESQCQTYKNETGKETKSPKRKRSAKTNPDQIKLFVTKDDDEILKEIENLDINRMTPIEALCRLEEFKKKIKNRW